MNQSEGEATIKSSDGETEELVKDLRLVATNYKETGSMEAVSVSYSDDKPVAGETVDTSVIIRNTGLKAAEGYKVKVYEVINGVRSQKPVYETTEAQTGIRMAEEGEDDETINNGFLPGVSVSETFEWKLPEDFTGIKSISLYAEVTETGIDEKAATCTVELEGIKIETDYRITNAVVLQTPEGFVLSYDITNEGNATFKDQEVSVKAEFNDLYRAGVSEIWFTEPIDSIGYKETVHCTNMIGISDSLLNHGFANGFVDIVDKDENSVGIGSSFIAALEYPSRIIVNDDADLDTIELRVGESIELNGSYAPQDFYKGGTVEFDLEDGEIAHLSDGRLIADEPGTTTIKAFVYPYGGEKLITVNILAKALELNINSAEIATKEELQLTAVVTQEDAENKKVIWTSSNEEIATVDENGKVTAFRYGKVTITAALEADNTASDTCEIQTRFYDVNDPGKYYYTPVYWAADKEITTGYDRVYFGPQKNCTRQELAIFLWRLAGKPEVSGTIKFPDVVKMKLSKTSDTYKAILWGVNNGITNGYKDGNFQPKTKCLREHIVTFIYRARNLIG